MKRSKMVKMIEELLDSTFGPNDQIADFILLRIEENGILPPKACVEGIIRIGNEERIIYRNVNEWEDE